MNIAAYLITIGFGTNYLSALACFHRRFSLLNPLFGCVSLRLDMWIASQHH